MSLSNEPNYSIPSIAKVVALQSRIAELEAENARLREELARWEGIAERAWSKMDEDMDEAARAALKEIDNG